jgi:hypothetical protein
MTDQYGGIGGTPLPQGPAWFSLTGLIQGLQAVAQALYRINQTLGNSYVSLAGNNTFTGSNTFSQPIIGATYTVATLPSASTKGQRAFVSDANATTFDSIVAGSGTNYVPVFADGTNWRIG